MEDAIIKIKKNTKNKLAYAPFVSTDDFIIITYIELQSFEKYPVLKLTN